ncbi:MAG: ATP-binding cassette domain-containing protein [Deltaproteobacteria bacterium]|jgi:ABC-type nitrate/sulfonate/bicarbonate transport system ATPase subunit|nr:ATP-binding cassette domain-containing protein [Deltaproteobacteria bacterium]
MSGPDQPAALSGKVLLELSGVSKSFGRQKVIDEASLSLRGGRVMALVGPSGVGKSTLLEIMAGLTRPDSGRVSINTPPSLLFQDNSLIPWLSALANLTYILPGSMPPGQAGNLALYWLAKFGLDPEKFPQAMSGGMRRRLALARTLAAGRALVILDEPFAFLDSRWHELIIALVAQMAHNGALVVLAGHSVPHSLSAIASGRLDVAEVASQPIRLRWP